MSKTHLRCTLSGLFTACFFASLRNQDEDVTAFTESTVDDLSCSVADVYKVLSSLDVKKAKGPDAISPRILKECAAELTP